jgi:hypothetical protein
MKSINFYSRIPKKVSQVAECLCKLLESGDYDNALIMDTYFRPYWHEFTQFWTGELLIWETFALAPHNARWLIEYVLVKYPEVLEQLIIDLKAAGHTI